MSVTSPAVITPGVAATRRSRIAAVTDGAAVAVRNLIAYVRVPQLLVFSTIQPVVFVILFRYVFGGAIQVPGGDYVNYMMPGIFAQTVVFGAMGTAIGLATDMQSGLIERFRSLPMARSAVLTGRTSADLFRNVFVLVLMCVVGVLVGWSIGGNAAQFLFAMALMLLFGYAMSWVFACVGLLVKDPETAQAAAFPVMAPLIFASTAFVPASTMPEWLQKWAENQPLSVVTDAVRGLTQGQVDTSQIWTALAWCVGIIAVAGPIAVWQYRRAE